MDPPRSSDQGGVDQNPVDAADNGAVSNQIGDLIKNIETLHLDTNMEVKEIKEGVTKLQEQMQDTVEEIRKIQAHLATLPRADANLGQIQELVDEIVPMQANANIEEQNQGVIGEIAPMQAGANLEVQNQDLVREIGPIQEGANLEVQNQEHEEEIGQMQAADDAGVLRERIEEFVREFNGLVIQNGKFTDLATLQRLVQGIIDDIHLILPVDDYDYQLTIVRLNDTDYSYDHHAIRRQETSSPRGLNDIRNTYPHFEILISLRRCPDPVEILNKIKTILDANFVRNDFQLIRSTEKHLVLLILYYYFLRKYQLTIPQFILPL